jgi:2-haloacid dehalogenase
MWKALEQGQITPAALGVRRFELLFEALSLPPLPASFSPAYLQHLADSAELNEGAEALLQALHPRYHLAILTNGLKAVQRSRLARSTIRDYIEALIISEEVGAAKPDPAIFDAAMAQMGGPPKAAVLMIGDSLSSDIRGAQRYGLDTCWYNPASLPRPAGVEPLFEIQTLGQLQTLLKQVDP